MLSASETSTPLPAFLVEDSSVIRRSLTSTLAEIANIDVIGFAEGQDAAVGWFRAHPVEWRLAIVDLFLMDGNGFGVLTSLRRRGPGQKVVVLTNYATEQIRIRCKIAGADAVFDKSTELEEFLDYCVYGIVVDK